MVDVFISYSRNDKEAVARLAKKIESEGYKVWWDAELPPHKSYGEVITAKIEDAKAAVVVWSPDAAKSEWVRAEADMARNYKKLVQTALGDIIPPLPFNQIQFADIGDWNGEDDHPGWAKVMVSLRELCGEREPVATASTVGAEPAPVVPPVPPASPSEPAAASRMSAAPAPEPAPIQNFAAPPPGSAASQPSSSPKWPIFAGLGCAGIASLGFAALVVLGMEDTEEAADAPPMALVGPAGEDGVAGDPAAGTSGPDITANPGSAPPAQPNPAPPPAATAPASQTFTGALNQGQSSSHLVNLNAGMSYTIVGGCDVDCSDIDMQIYDENGNLIDEDVLDDDVPVLEVTPIRSAQFRLEIGMYACTIAPCGYQINVEGN